MTREGRQSLLTAAVLVSVALHVGVMFLARSRVMSHVIPSTVRASHRAPMRVTKDVPQPESLRLDQIEDLLALQEAPSVAQDANLPVPTPAFDANRPAQEAIRTVAPPPVVTPSNLERPMVDVAPLTPKPTSAAATIPVSPIETPRPSRRILTAPEIARDRALPARANVPAAPRLSAPGVNPDSVFLPERLRRDVEDEKSAFKPAQEVYAKVDEKVVEEEKKAVRDLLNDLDNEPAELEKVVSVRLAKATRGEWTYFKASIAPLRSLEVVPKDLVLLLDGSGSIGADRLASCRSAARRILRSATNSDDRFNLVVFRNRFAYAFRSWQTCSAQSFAAADRWLSNETAHGRTDVFSTISSVLTLPRDPSRPLIALVVTDGDANVGVSETAEILSKFTTLNGGLVSIYMYGVKSAANRDLIDVLTHGNRGESFVYDGWRWKAGEGIDALSERFRDPVLSDLGVVFAASSPAETYPRTLRNLYRNAPVEFFGRVRSTVNRVSFNVRGLNGARAHDGFFAFDFASVPEDNSVVSAWEAERALDGKLHSPAR